VTARKKKELEAARKKLTVTRTLIWTPPSGEGREERGQTVDINVPQAALQALGFVNEGLLAAHTQLVAQAALDGVGAVARQAQPGQGDLPARSGIIYRQPAHVMLRVCAPNCAAAESAGFFVAEQYAYAAVHSLPQYGIKASLPLTNFLFEDNSLGITFGESGQPKVLTFKSKAAAERAAASAKDIGESYLGYVKASEADRLEFLKNRRSDEEGQLSLESKRRDAQLDTLSDRLDTMKKLEALEATRAGTATRTQLYEDSLEARKRQLKLLIEIREQEKKLQELNATP
jgi:hypothetical protein